MTEFIYETAQSKKGIMALDDALERALMKHSRVLWLVCGGSSITKIVAAMHSLPSGLSTKLHIMLTDERYGKPGHPDSNYQQLLDTGFNQKQGTFIATLQPGLSLSETAASYGTMFQKEAGEAGYIIATFGIGPDSHIAGILPGSPASKANQPACGYTAGQFKRLTLTFPSLKQIDTAFAFVYGENKHEALVKLQRDAPNLSEQPCQILKTIPESYVYNNCIP